ncbi:hypothetical protein AA313_de0209236 [Arthrobotrys entomopaga]|nr:hypothetical protein AA313_de0209236 [Arthrobotrys entomopaga]
MSSRLPALQVRAAAAAVVAAATASSSSASISSIAASRSPVIVSAFPSPTLPSTPTATANNKSNNNNNNNNNNTADSSPSSSSAAAATAVVAAEAADIPTMDDRFYNNHVLTVVPSSHHHHNHNNINPLLLYNNNNNYHYSQHQQQATPQPPQNFPRTPHQHQHQHQHHQHNHLNHHHHSLPMTPNTPSSSNTSSPAPLWNPARGIIFAPTPITPPPSSSRGYKTWNPRPDSSSQKTPTMKQQQQQKQPTPQTPSSVRRRSMDWANLMNLTPDGREKESTPSGFNAFKQDISQAAAAAFTTPSDETGGPLAKMNSLSEALDDIVDQEVIDELLEGEETASFEDQDDDVEDPGIERVKTPEGIDIIMWKKKPIVYCDETDPHVASSYQPNEELVDAAIEAKGNFDMKHYQNEEEETPAVEYVTDLEEMERVAKLFEGDKVVGFDMEWHWMKRLVPPRNDKDIRYCCSVIQVSNDKTVAIFHLAKFPADTKAFLSTTLKKIIEDESVIKTGVQIKNDMRRLALLIPVNPAGIVDLADFHSLLFAAQGNTLENNQKLPASLKGLTEHYLRLPLDKGEVRTSDWSKSLDENQKIYAANDVYASYRVFDSMDEVRRSLDPRPALPPHSSINHLETVELYYKKAARPDKTKGKKPTAIRVPKDPSPQLAKAYEWVKEYAKTVPGEVLNAAVADLRCYSLWHHQNMDVEDVAAACRDPPLTTGYVATRILNAVREEQNLTYDATRLLWVFRDLPEQGARRFFALKSAALAHARAKKPEVPITADHGVIDHGEYNEPEEAQLRVRFKYTLPAEVREKPPTMRYTGGDDQTKLAETLLADTTTYRTNNDEPLIRKLPETNPHEARVKFVQSDVTRKREVKRMDRRQMGAEEEESRPLVRMTMNTGRPRESSTVTISHRVDQPKRWSSIEDKLNAVGGGQSMNEATETPLGHVASTGATIALGSSGELGDAIEGIAINGGHRFTEADDEVVRDVAAVARKQWIGVPSRRRKVQPTSAD